MCPPLSVRRENQSSFPPGTRAHTQVRPYRRHQSWEEVMRTNIVLNEDLVAEAQRLTGLRTKRGLIDHALRELVRRRQQRRSRCAGASSGKGTSAKCGVIGVGAFCLVGQAFEPDTLVLSGSRVRLESLAYRASQSR